MKLQFNGVAPSINENAYVSESVDIIGDVKVEENNTSTNNNDEQTESLNFLEKGENIIYKETIKKKRKIRINKKTTYNVSGLTDC